MEYPGTLSRNYYSLLDIDSASEVSLDSQPAHAWATERIQYRSWVPIDARNFESLRRHDEELVGRYMLARQCNLCRWCAKLDLLSLRNGRIPLEWESFEITDRASAADIKGYFGSVQKRRTLLISQDWTSTKVPFEAKPPGTGCPLCRILRSICREIVPEKEDFNVNLMLREPIPMCLDDCNNSEPWSTIDIIATIGTIKRTVTLMPLLLQAELDGPIKHNCTAKHEVPSLADFRQLAGWVQACDEEHHHEFQTNSSDHIRSTARFVDVKNKCLVEKPLNHKFAALSYTWGNCSQFKLTKDRLEELRERQALRNIWKQLSIVAIDAIAACERLNIPFLWIDTLCIVNDDQEEKHNQIANMDQIYSSAYITMIVAAGSDANAGLPRVTKRITHKSRTLKLGDSAFQITNASDWDSNEVDKSAWCTRGWTFQELVLSRRVLVFTPTEIFFYCSRGFHAESMHEKHESNQEFQFGATVLRICNSIKPHLGASPKYSIKSVRHSYEGVHWTLLNNYLGRQLSYDTDILNAFSGVLNAEGATIGPSIFGLPYKILARALFWDLNNLSFIHAGQSNFKSSEFSMKRRPFFPSWSWTGWKIAKDDIFSSESGRSMIKNTISTEAFMPLIHIYHIEEDGNFESLMGKRSETHGVEGFDPREVEVFNHSMRHRKSQRDVPPALDTAAVPSTHFQNVLPHCLVFVASCASFQVSQRADCRDQDHTFGLYRILTEGQGQQTNTSSPRVWLDIHWREMQDQDQEFDFVLIGVSIDRTGPRNGKRQYHALLVHHQDGIAERIAIPQTFSLDQWYRGNPSKQWIALG
ncbi:hypothetical protein ACN47E_007587 [Coniothyrium glycines]